MDTAVDKGEMFKEYESQIRTFIQTLSLEHMPMDISYREQQVQHRKQRNAATENSKSIESKKHGSCSKWKAAKKDETKEEEWYEDLKQLVVAYISYSSTI